MKKNNRTIVEEWLQNHRGRSHRIQVIADATGLSESAVNNAVRWLVDQGRIRAKHGIIGFMA